jgi:hypothetical protein
MVGLLILAFNNNLVFVERRYFGLSVGTGVGRLMSFVVFGSVLAFLGGRITSFARIKK